MNMSKHHYRYFNNEDDVIKLWNPILELIKNHFVCNVYGVWDNIDNKWFDDCPIVVQFNVGFLCVNVQNENDLSLGWNDIDLNEKPYWFDVRDDEKIIKELNWKEDLIWKKYDELGIMTDKKIRSVQIISDRYGLRGIAFHTEDNSLIVENAGDCIIVKFA